ncbi:MAG: DUF4870 domain-containing protein [Arenimonas sp.]
MSEVSQDDKTMGMIAHLSAIIVSFVGPLVIWLINKDKADKGFVVDHAKEALNFCITVFAVAVGTMILSMVFAMVPVVGWIISIILSFAMFAIGIGALVLLIMAGLKANSGETYRYPFAFRLIK